MEEAIQQLSACNDTEDFLQTTRLILTVLHNIIQEPLKERHRRLKANSKFLQRAGVVKILVSVGFQKQNDYYVLPNGPEEEHLKVLRSCMKELVTRRRQTNDPLGWDIPSSALHFTKVIGMSKYGDIFQGNLDGQDVAIKTLRPDSTVIASNAFKRELDILSKLNHPHVVKLLGATLLAEPTSLIIELLPHSMLGLLHHGELCDVEVFRYARQVAIGVEYLHSKNILHCDLAARNLLVSAEGEVRICDFSLSCIEGENSSTDKCLNIRWSSPEVLLRGEISRYSDVWSYGVLLYEFVTAGSVPYANFSNNQVKEKVIDGYRLSQPPACLNEFYSLMIRCWNTEPTNRPQFRDIIALLLDPLETMLASISDERIPRNCGTLIDECRIERKLSKKCKIKEPSFQSVNGKGGGLMRVYTALVAPFHPRIVMVYSKKMTMLDAVQLALSKCGKSELDYRSYAIALLDESHEPVKYLGPDDKIMTIKGSVSQAAKFVLCIRTPEKSLLEVIASIRQNPSYRNALDTRTRGYLIKSNSVNIKGSLKARNSTTWQRYWCVLDGSSLLLYNDEEDEGIKQFDSYLDFNFATISLISDKKSNNIRVETKSDEVFLFTSSDKSDAMRWLEAMDSCTLLEPSPVLLQASGGTIVHAGFLTCQRIPLGTEFNPLQPMIQGVLGDIKQDVDPTIPVNYGKLWSVIKSSGIIQCMVEGKPHSLVNITECNKINIYNPANCSSDGTEYKIKLETTDWVYMIKADLPTDHHEWVLSFEGILRQKNLSFILINSTNNRHSGYVALKRLLSLQDTGVRGSQLMSPITETDILSDLYTDSIKFGSRQSPDGCEGEESYTEGPPIPPRGSSAPPPPLPPRDPPPLPPKRGNSLQRSRTVSIASTNSSTVSMDLDEYVIMQPHPPNSLKFTSPTHSLTTTSYNIVQCSIPSPINEDYMPMKSVVNGNDLQRKDSTTPPISIPVNITRRGSSVTKRCVLLRSSSDVDNTNNEVTPPLPPRGSSPRHVRTPSSGSTNSLSRNCSYSSLSASFNGRSSGRSSHTSVLLDKSHPPSCGASPLRSASTATTPIHKKHAPPTDVSMSDGLIIKDVKTQLRLNHAYSQAESIGSSSDNGLDISGLSSSESSTEDISQGLPSGWERGYCKQSKKHFYFNASLGVSKWNYNEVMEILDQKPGIGWNEVYMEDGRVYYYHEDSRLTTWNIQDTFC